MSIRGHLLLLFVIFPDISSFLVTTHQHFHAMCEISLYEMWSFEFCHSIVCYFL
jgi:hypothetical protein